MYDIIINTKKMWSLIAICYIGFYIGIQYVVLVINPNIFSVPIQGSDVFFFEMIFNLALCQLLPLGMSFNYLNKTYNLREKIPLRIIFNGERHNSESGSHE